MAGPAARLAFRTACLLWYNLRIFMSPLDPRIALLWPGVVVACVALYLCWRRLRGHAPSRVAVLLVLRALLLGLLILAIANPALHDDRPVSRPPTLLIALDSSASMTRLPLGGPSRYATALEALRAGPIADAITSCRPLRYAVSASAQPVREFADDPVGAMRTDLQSTLSEILRQPRSPRPAACLLVSDGADDTNRPPARVAAALEGYGVPVFCLGVGDPGPVPDARVLGLIAPEIVSEGDRFEVRVLVGAAGLEDAPVDLTLSTGGEIIQRRSLADGPAERPATFEVTAGAPGYHRYTVEVVPGAEEVTGANNRRSFVVRVEPRGTRLLLIEGRPRREYAFLRRFLLRIEDLETVILLRKRRPAEFWFDAGNPRRAEGLSAAGELRRFRAIIISNIEASALSAGFVRQLARYVTEGGALAMLGGEDAFAAGGWEDTALADVLSVRMGEGMLGDPLSVRVMGGSDLAARLRSVEGWQRLPLLDGMNAVMGVPPGAEVAMEAISAGSPVGPVIATGRHGAGRTLAVTVSDTWRWQQSPGADEHSRAAWETFWTSIAGWLIAPRAERQVVIDVGRDSVEAGVPVPVEVLVRDADYEPVDDATVTVSASGAGVSEEIAAARIEAPGVYRAIVRPREPGSMALTATAVVAGDSIGSDSRELEVVEPVGELTHAARPDVLRAIAERTGGAYRSVEEAEELAALLPLEPTTERRVVTHRPARSPWFFAIVLLVAGTDWLLRRRWGVG